MRLGVALALLVLAAFPAGIASGQSGLEFTDWKSSSNNMADGTLRGQAVAFGGTRVDATPASTTDGSQTIFDQPQFTPRLPQSDAISFYGGVADYEYTLSISTGLSDPVMHIASLASRLDFAAGTPIERVSGDPDFVVQGSSITGALNGAADASGTVRFRGAVRSLRFTATKVFQGSSDDGIYLQLGAPPPATTSPGPTPTPTSPTTTPSTPEPEAGVTVVVARQAGSVLVKRGNAFVPLGDAEAIPVGATVDARKGVVALAAAGDASATIAAGIFRVKQARALGAATDLALVTPRGRARACASRATRPAKGVVRRLRVRVGKGVFRTIGKRSVGKGRNASWVTADGCGGTRTTVSRGRVKVRAARRTRTLKAGESFIARARLFGAKTRRHT